MPVELTPVMRRERYCEQCNAVIGVMTDAAYEAAGRLCEDCGEPA